MPFSNDLIMDAALDKIATGTIMTVCSQQPTTRAEAVTTYALADATLSGGDFTKANGDVSGRKVTIAQKSNVPIDVSGTATCVAVCDGTSLLIVADCVPQPLTSGGTVTVPAFKDEFGDAVSV